MLLPAPYDIFIERGIAYGPLVITVYDGLPPLNAPSAPTITPVGSDNNQTWSYQIIGRKTSTGQFSAASVAGSTADGANNLTPSGNYNRIRWSAVDGANIYDVYRTVSGGNPATLGLIVSTANLSFNDTGVAGDGSTPSTTGGPGAIVNLTGFTAHAQARRIPDDTLLQDLAPAILAPASNGQIQIGKFTDEQTLAFKQITNGRWSLVLENSGGDWLPAIVAGAYSVTSSVTRNQP